MHFLNFKIVSTAFLYLPASFKDSPILQLLSLNDLFNNTFSVVFRNVIVFNQFFNISTFQYTIYFDALQSIFDFLNKGVIRKSFYVGNYNIGVSITPDFHRFHFEVRTFDLPSEEGSTDS